MAVAGESRNMVVDAIVSWPTTTVIEIQLAPVAARFFKDRSVPGPYKPYLGASKDFQSLKCIPFMNASMGGRGRVWPGMSGGGRLGAMGVVGLIADVAVGVGVDGNEVAVGVPVGMGVDVDVGPGPWQAVNATIKPRPSSQAQTFISSPRRRRQTSNGAQLWIGWSILTAPHRVQ